MNDVSPPGRTGHWRYFTEDGTDIRLWINEPPDAIQAIIEATGTFYEAAALRLLRELLPADPRIVDIGANFGNHSVYFARICGAARVLPIEPNPEIIPELRANLAANECTADLSCLGVAAGARRGQLHLCLDPADAVIFNRGGTRLVDSMELATGTAVPVVPLDEIVTDEVDLVKIDVEGMAVPVLEGARALLARCAPLIFVEIGVSEMSAFFDWLSASSYRVAGALSDYVGLINLILQPTTLPPRAVAGWVAHPQARIAQALTEAEAAGAHAKRADETLLSTLVRSAALERSHIQMTAQAMTQIASLTETVRRLDAEIGRLRRVEGSTIWQATKFLRRYGEGAPQWLRNALRRGIKSDGRIQH
jgi:FkbM family methyltransferase